MFVVPWLMLCTTRTLSLGDRRGNARVLAAALSLALAAHGACAQGMPLDGRAAQVFENYRLQAPHKAFAVAPGGATQWFSGRKSPEEAADLALKRCAERAKSDCSLYAVNDFVVAGRDWKSAVPERAPNAPDIGRLRPHPYTPILGPEGAKGLVVWSHGYTHGANATETPPQAHVGRFVAAGYDLYRFDRPWIANWGSDANDLTEAVAEARKLGYRRIVLTGQSAGAWVSLAALGRGAAADGVIAVAPAHHGETLKMRDPSVAKSDWQHVVRAIKPGPRVAIALFKDDTYDVGGRGKDVRAAFAGGAVQAVLIDEPNGITGHGGGWSSEFATRYGACLFDFIETGAAAAPCG
jgi:hypothetical protein